MEIIKKKTESKEGTRILPYNRENTKGNASKSYNVTNSNI
jgi:hypothetical protein